MNERIKFSDRGTHFTPKETEITIRNDAPLKLRGVLPLIAHELGLSPKPMRKIVCRILRERPDSNNWTEYPNIEDEVKELIDNCQWYEVYDIIEEVYGALNSSGRTKEAEKFSVEINNFFVKEGIGWQFKEGLVEIRGPEAFESAVTEARDTLEEDGRITASNEIHEALLDLSRRPKPDLTGALQHSVAALECVARDVTGKPKLNLERIIKKHPGLIPPPLDEAVVKIWGFSSEQGRHLREGRNPDFKEVELIVGLSSVVASYLSKKNT